MKEEIKKLTNNTWTDHLNFILAVGETKTQEQEVIPLKLHLSY